MATFEITDTTLELELKPKFSAIIEVAPTYINIKNIDNNSDGNDYKLSFGYKEFKNFYVEFGFGCMGILKSLKGLKNLNSLVHLRLNNCKINEISRIENLKYLNNLKTLDLDCNKIETLCGLEKLKNLESLFINNNKIETLCGLKELKNLEKLFINNNKIETLCGLEKLKKLEYIEIYGNPITKINNIYINLRINNEIRIDRNVTYYIGGWKEDKKLWSYCYDFKDISILLLVLRDIMPPEIIDMICEQLYLVTYHYDF